MKDAINCYKNLERPGMKAWADEGFGGTSLPAGLPHRTPVTIVARDGTRITVVTDAGEQWEINATNCDTGLHFEMRGGRIIYDTDPEGLASLEEEYRECVQNLRETPPGGPLWALFIRRAEKTGWRCTRYGLAVDWYPGMWDASEPNPEGPCLTPR